MKKMKLAGEWLPQNVGRPSSRFDFDLMIGSTEYKHGTQILNGSMWKTSLTKNFCGLVISMILWPAAFYVTELHDGRIASIAFHPSGELFKAITGWTESDI